MKRSTTILVAVLVVQIIIYALVSRDRYHVEEKVDFLSIDTSQVDYLKITNDDGTLVLNRVGVHWKIVEPVNWAANESYVETLLEKVAEMKRESIITDNPEKFVLYELDDPVAKYVEIGQQGGIIDKFYCGKASDSYKHTYIRLADKEEVWLVTGNPRSSFTRQPDQWRDKKILALDQTMIEQIRLKFPRDVIDLERSIKAGVQTDSGYVLADTSWLAIPQKGSPFTPVDKALNRITNTLKRLNAISFLDAGKDQIPDFSKPDFGIEVTLEGNQHETLDFVLSADDSTRYVARKNGDEATVFVVYQSSVKNLQKDVPALRGEDEKEN